MGEAKIKKQNEEKRQKGVESEIGKNVAEENKKEEKELKVGWWIEENVLKCVVPLQDAYLSLGILANALIKVNMMLETNRMINEEKRKQLEGKDTLLQQAKQNPGFWKKTFGKK